MMNPSDPSAPQPPSMFSPGGYHPGPLFPSSPVAAPQPMQQPQAPQGNYLQFMQQGAAISPFTQVLFSSGSNYLRNNMPVVNGDAVRRYFDVSNSYVINKLKLIVIPFLHRGGWRRQSINTDDGGKIFLPPRDDINAPDLYIPLMAFITYVLIYSLLRGVEHDFTPEVLSWAATKGLSVLALEIIAVRTAMYVINTSVRLLDLIAYLSYVFVGVVCSMLSGLALGGSPAVLVVALYMGIAMASFVVRTLRLFDSSEGPSDFETPRSSLHYHRYFLLIVGAFQVVMMLVLSL
eukprot:m51a1_g4544 hypothetical protein (291) ;mRNA; r:58845-60420